MMKGARYWAEKTDLERLFGASHICYLIGGYDGSGNYGDIVALAANLKKLRPVAAKILFVPLIELQCLESHQDLGQQLPSLFGDTSFLCYSLRSDPQTPDIFLGKAGVFAELTHPPSASTQILVYGGGFFNDRWGKRKLEVIEALEAWLGSTGENETPSPSLAVVGQQISPQFVEGPEAGRFARLLTKAKAVGVRDEISLQAIAGSHEAGVSAKLFVSGDDAAAYIVERGGGNNGKFRDAVSSGGRTGESARPLAINVHLSLERYVTDNPDKLFETILSIVRHAGKLSAGNLVVNLIAAYEDRRIAESKYLERLAGHIEPWAGAVNRVKLIADLGEDFPSFGRADLTVCCSYHVALTSLLLSVPPILLYANEYYAHKHEGLRRLFGLPERLLFDVEEGDRGELLQTIAEAVQDSGFRAGFAGLVAQGGSSLAASAAKTNQLLLDWLASGYVGDLETKYRALVARHAETLAQLSDLQFDCDRLFHAHQADRLAEHEELRRQLFVYQTALRFQIAERAYNLFVKSRLGNRIGQSLAHWLWRVLRPH